MSSKSKAKGTAFESKVVKTINEWVGHEAAERIVLHGNKDYGDIRMWVGTHQLTIECKWREKYPPDSDEKDFRDQTDREANNAMTDGGILVINKYNQSIWRAECWMHLSTAWIVLGMEPPLEYVETEHDWVCCRMLDFLWTCYGAPAWENRRQ